MARVTLSAARRRLAFRADEIAFYVDHLTDDNLDQLVGHARAAWSIALSFPSDIVADLVFEAHQAEDPHCTCNDCIDVLANQS